MSPAAKKGGRRAVDQEPEAQEPEEIPEAVLRLQEIAGTGDGNLIAYLYRKNVGDLEDEFLDRVGLESLLEDPEGFLKTRYGGGRFHIRVRDGRTFVKGGSQYLKIGGPPKDHHEMALDSRLDALEEKWQERLKAANGGAGQPEMWFMLSQTLAELRQEIRRPQGEAVAGANPLELTIGLLETVSAAALPLILKIIERKDDRPDPMEQMESMLRVMTMMKEISGPPADGFGALVQTLGQPLAGLMNQHVRNQQDGTAPASTMLPPGGGARPTPTTPENPNVPRPSWYPLLQRAIPQLLTWAEQEKDPALRAAIILEDLDDAYLEPVYGELARGDAFLGEFITQVPAAVPHREWFRVFFGTIYAEMRGWLEDGEGTVPDPEPPAVWELGEGEPPDDDVDQDGAPA